MNIKNLLISDSIISSNFGQFASVVPAHTDTVNPLLMFIEHNTFSKNYAKADALIQLTTNSKLYTKNTTFLENYSIGRGSVLFADYQ